MSEVNRKWNKLLSHLKDQPKFDRAYFESLWEKNLFPMADKSQDRKSSMYKCLEYIGNSGTKFEKTGNKTLNQLSEKILNNFPRLFPITNFLRENYVCYRIDKTLLPGESGILFYGQGHEKKLITKINKLDNLKLEIFPVSPLL